ncbi:MAG: hypothetical protein AAFX04_03000 [Pseudomonadota bacterium]
MTLLNNPILHHTIFHDTLIADLVIDRRIGWFRDCKPRILIVADGSLGFDTNGFGLTRFIEALTVHNSTTLQPTIKLAHRGPGADTSVTIAGTTYDLDRDFDFASASPSVTTGNYDQIWMFGISTSAISNSEVETIAEFMNAGGGVFSTGDHAALGAGMGNRLPRIRHMREWAGVPMGTETLPTALNRIDTVVDPGANDIYEFSDQGDDIPQRIYPNYSVTGPGGSGGWTATVHPLLLLSGAPLSRLSGDPALFSNDMDVLPDHPHESECYAVTDPNVLDDDYTEAGMNFKEFRRRAGSTDRVGSEIVAFAVSGGRSVFNGVWKPPVTPRMFGVISAYDGHQCNPYPNQNARPGRIVCDATWHHFVNVNLEGMGTTVGGSFMPDINLSKIYRYYQNTVKWLMPSNRRRCFIFTILTATRFHFELIEEITTIGKIREMEDLLTIGAGAFQIIENAIGPGTAENMVAELLRSDESTAEIGDRLVSATNGLGADDKKRIVDMTLGNAVAMLVEAMPAHDDERTLKLIGGDAAEEMEERLQKQAVKSVEMAVKVSRERLEARAKALERFAGKKAR